MKFSKLIELSIFRCRVSSSDVKPPKTLQGYSLALLCAQASNAIFASHLNRYYGDVIGRDKFGASPRCCPCFR